MIVAVPASAGPSNALRRAESLERELSKSPAKLKQRRNLEPVIEAFEAAAKASSGDARMTALDGLARSLETLARWSGRSEDRAEAKRARARYADVKAARRGERPLELAKRVAPERKIEPVKKEPGRPHELAKVAYELEGPSVVVALELPSDVEVRTEEIPAGKGKGLRFVVDLSPVVAARTALRGTSVGHAGVGSLRVGQLDGDTVRLVFDFAEGAARPEVMTVEREGSPRVVIRPSATEPAPVEERAAEQGASPTPDIPMPSPIAPPDSAPAPSAPAPSASDTVRPASRGPQPEARIERDPAMGRSDVLERQRKEQAARGLDALVRDLTSRGRAEPNANSDPREAAPAAEPKPAQVVQARTEDADDAEHFKAALPPIQANGLHKRTREALRPRGEPGLVRVRRVVVDAGHGGKDTGAIGKRGTLEKDVNLALAKDVSRELEGMGIEVVMTRSTDEFVSLPERTAIASRAGADLFVSVHSNANRNRRLQGIETYFLDTTSNRYSARLAQRENAAGEGAHEEVDIDPSEDESSEAGALPAGPMGQDIRMLLADLAMRSATSESRRLAGAVQGSIVGSLRQKGVRAADLGVKNALFYVLLGVRMPSILIESGFVTHPEEEARLASASYRKDLAKAIAAGVYRYAREREQLASN